jgi:PTH1 family peptidyl-tRNA hydrolase
LGADVVTLLANRHNAPLKRGKERAIVAEARIDGKLLALAFPQTFVNLSGESAARLVRRYGVEGDMSRVVVVHDELDLPPGRVKIKEGGGTAGHNGLESIRAHLHTGAFIRIRIGIGKPPGRQQGADFVLKPARKAEQMELDVAVVEAAEAVELIFTDGLSVAMNRVNSTPA